MKRIAAPLLAGLVLGAAPSGAVAATDPLAALKASCTTKRSTDRPARRAANYRICAGPVRSFDGTELDTTLTLPARVAPGGRLPLIVFLHGLFVAKGERLSETRVGNGRDRGGDVYKTYQWNNVWFASKGYAVLNYTARGHEGSGGEIQLASKDFEIRDTRFLVGLLADDAAAHVDPARVAALGTSYGGGQAWLLLTTREDSRLQYGEWRSPAGRTVRLATVVAGFTWTDLLYSLAPNGRHRSSGVDPATATTPFGVGKQTLINGALATLRERLTPQIARWLTRFNAGEPYDSPDDPVVPEAKRALTQDRSAFYQDGFFAALGARRQRLVPVLAVQGWTDPIFPAIETLRMYRRLRAARRDYPIQVYLGDFEHLTALVKVPDLIYAHMQGNLLLDHVLRGRGFRPPPDVRSMITECDARRIGRIVRAQDWDALGPQRLAFDLSGGQATASPLTDPRGSDSDPVLVSQTRGRGCITTTAPTSAGVASWTFPVTRDFTLLGLPRLRLRFRTSAPDLELNSRLWDVGPDGTHTLITRGAYRAVAPNPMGDEADYELFGNAWRLRRGHLVRLEVVQSDAPFLRTDNFASSALIDGGRLELPGRFG